MNILGASHQFFGDVVPSDYRGEIFSLVDTAWLKVKKPFKTLEPRITGLLKTAMIAEQEAQYENDPPFHIAEDVKIRDPITGKEKERTDIEIHLRHHYIKALRPYFVFESKKLNIPYAGAPTSTNVHEYVGGEGMGCLLAGGYNTVAGYSGMIAYVMDGNVATAKNALENHLARKSSELHLDGEAKVQNSTFMPKNTPHGETRHSINSRPLTLFHIFLPFTSASRKT